MARGDTGYSDGDDGAGDDRDGDAAHEGVRPLAAADVRRWDAEADVVVVGYGIAGAAAAIEAARAGADVAVLERSVTGGGASALSDGIVYLGGGTPIQQVCGFDDSVEDMTAFLCAALGPGADENRIADYCAGSVAHFGWLAGCGVPFTATFWGEPGWGAPGAHGLCYTGGENSSPFNTIAKPAPRGHVPPMRDPSSGRKDGGDVLMAALARTAQTVGVRVRTDTPVRRLITESGGGVVGVLAEQHGASVAVRARRGVVLATGSFAYNASMVARYAPRIAGRPAAAIEQHDGRAIRMAQAVGADLAHMDATEVAFFADPQMMARGILVNTRGQRYVAEDTYPGRIGLLTLYQQDDAAFLVIDTAAHGEARAAASATPFFKYPLTWVRDSLGELEHDMGLVGGALQATVAAYNAAAQNGADPLLGKKPEWVRPIGTPVGAIELRGKTAGFTLGGLHTTLDAQVLHVDGTPIPGLFAAGRAAAGLSAWGYASGVSLGDGSFSGRRAGTAAARASV